MINTLKTAIAKRLRNYFPTYHIYIENPAQSIEEPCFIIECVNTGNKDLMTIEYEPEVIEFDYLFSVTLLLPRDNKKLNEIVPVILACLKWVYLDNGKPVITLNRQGHPIDDSSYSVTFNIQRETILEGMKPPLMEEMWRDVRLDNEKEEKYD